jgi:hypothetical protein
MNWGRLNVANHRGKEVPRILGLPLLAAGAAGTGLAAAGGVTSDRAAWTTLAASVTVFAAGLVDDLTTDGPRGIRAHVRELAAARITSGIVKVVVIVGASATVVAVLPDRPSPVSVAGAIGVAACANLWNGLDVVPGRALKVFLLTGVPVAIGGLASDAGWSLAPAVPSIVVAGALVLAADLRERAMLGDSGANLLGFTIGLGLYMVLPDAGVVAAAILAVVLNAVAETVTLSRGIERSRPLRWLDGLGRLPSP